MKKYGAVLQTEIGLEVWQMLFDNNLQYHNTDHIIAMWDYLEATVPYDPVLDWAVLFHDVIYDALPEKELRSADLAEKMLDGVLTPSELRCLWYAIYNTSAHSTKQCLTATERNLVYADLNALRNPIEAVGNYYKIYQESVKLYGVTQIEYAKSSKKFMIGLQQRCVENLRTDPGHEQFWTEVLAGISITIDISNAIVDRGLSSEAIHSRTR